MKPIPGACSVRDDRPLPLEFGGEVSPLTIEYESWGRLNREKGNAILICPAFSAHSHARSHDRNGDAGWWEAMIGPGRAFDTDDFFVICSSLLGSGYGTTGPRTLDVATGEPYAGSFPIISIRDIVDAQVRLLDHLGIDQLHGAAGGSMGAMETLELAVRYPNRVRRVLAMSGTDRTRPYTATIRHVGRRAIQLDPAFKKGHYGDRLPGEGLRVAREIGTIFYRSREDFNSRFSCEPVETPSLDGVTFDFQSYLKHMGNKIVGTLDPNAYLRLSLSMDLFNVSRGFENLEDALNRIEAQVFVMGVSQDPLIPIDEQRQLHDALLQAGVSCQWHELSSHYGHDAFLTEFDWLTPRIRKFLGAN